MNEQEGVTKYELHFTPSSPLPSAQLTELNAWRARFVRLELIGCHAHRYGGIGFGNLSKRLRPGAPSFAVTGTQTGHLPSLDERHYCVVTECDAGANRLSATGPIAPSSESLTHGQLYALAPNIHFVFHVHSPDIWRAAAALGIPTTHPHVAYGTPEMVTEVERLMIQTDVPQRQIFSMGGHEDGVVSFGATAEEAGTTLIRYLERAGIKNRD
jgi:L-ribulose-5-phosphate 4-epimerase